MIWCGHLKFVSMLLGQQKRFTTVFYKSVGQQTIAVPKKHPLRRLFCIRSSTE